MARATRDSHRKARFLQVLYNTRERPQSFWISSLGTLYTYVLHQCTNNRSLRSGNNTARHGKTRGSTTSSASLCFFLLSFQPNFGRNWRIEDVEFVLDRFRARIALGEDPSTIIPGEGLSVSGLKCEFNRWYCSQLVFFWHGRPQVTMYAPRSFLADGCRAEDCPPTSKPGRLYSGTAGMVRTFSRCPGRGRTKGTINQVSSLICCTMTFGRVVNSLA